MKLVNPTLEQVRTHLSDWVWEFEESEPWLASELNDVKRLIDTILDRRKAQPWKGKV